MKEIINSFSMPLMQRGPEDEGFRSFEVKFPSYVELPGCLEVEEVRLNGHRIPPFEEHEVPVDSTHKRFKTLQIPMYTLIEGPNDSALLLRSNSSNDGKWQVGASLLVKGRWEGDAAMPAAPPTKKELLARAAELGLAVNPKATNAEISAAIAEKEAAGQGS